MYNNCTSRIDRLIVTSCAAHTNDGPKSRTEESHRMSLHVCNNACLASPGTCTLFGAAAGLTTCSVFRRKSAPVLSGYKSGKKFILKVAACPRRRMKFRVKNRTVLSIPLVNARDARDPARDHRVFSRARDRPTPRRGVSRNKSGPAPTTTFLLYTLNTKHNKDF